MRPIPIHQSIYPSIHLFIHLFIHPSIHSSVHLSICPYVSTYIKCSCMHADLLPHSHVCTCVGVGSASLCSKGQGHTADRGCMSVALCSSLPLPSSFLLHCAGYGPLGYFGPPTNPGSFPIPPPPGYFPPPQPYSGPSYPDPNAAYSFVPGGYHGYNLPPASSTESTHPPILESTVSEECH